MAMSQPPCADDSDHADDVDAADDLDASRGPIATVGDVAATAIAGPGPDMHGGANTADVVVSQSDDAAGTAANVVARGPCCAHCDGAEGRFWSHLHDADPPATSAPAGAPGQHCSVDFVSVAMLGGMGAVCGPGTPPLARCGTVGTFRRSTAARGCRFGVGSRTSRYRTTDGALVLV